MKISILEKMERELKENTPCGFNINKYQVSDNYGFLEISDDQWNEVDIIFKNIYEESTGTIGTLELQISTRKISDPEKVIAIKRIIEVFQFYTRKKRFRKNKTLEAIDGWKKVINPDE